MITQILSIIGTLLCVLTLSVAAVTDLSVRRIPNALTLPAIAIGLTLSALTSIRTVPYTLITIFVIFIVGMFGVIGFGDLKLIMALVAFMGTMPTLWSVGVASVAILLCEGIRRPRETAESVKDSLRFLMGRGKMSRDGRRIPFAPYLLFGFTVWLTLSWFVF